MIVRGNMMLICDKLYCLSSRHFKIGKILNLYHLKLKLWNWLSIHFLTEVQKQVPYWRVSCINRQLFFLFLFLQLGRACVKDSTKLTFERAASASNHLTTPRRKHPKAKPLWYLLLQVGTNAKHRATRGNPDIRHHTEICGFIKRRSRYWTW